VVLDIGPGSGSHVREFSNNPSITRIFGAEPSIGLHSDLQERIVDAKLTSKYHILSSTADKAPLLVALRKQNVRINSDEQTFDTIVCIRVLCSVPELDKTTRELYQLLKPGGQILLVEHIKNPWTTTGSILARSMQIFYHLIGWKFFLGGCHLNRDIAAAWKNAGAWAKVDLKRDFEWAPFTYVSGTLTKPL
jgi:SAM-dependent methyltransferase